MRKNIYCTLDTETVGGAAHPTGMYNLGCVIHDKNGNIYASTSMLVMEHYNEIAKDDYAKKNLPIYQNSIQNGTMTAVATEEDAVRIVHDLCKMYGVKYVMAWNSAFDFGKTACKSLLEDFEFIDIWLMFFQTIAPQKKYNKFCCENGYLTKRHNVSMTAETAYRFLTQNEDFSEEHTAFSDANIEMALFVACMRTHKKFTRNVHKNSSEYRYKVIHAEFN